MNWKVATLVLIVAAYMVVAACLLGGLWPLVKRVRDRRGRVTGRHRQDAEAVTVTITAVALPLAPLPEMMLSAPVAVPGASGDPSTMVLPFTPDWRQQTRAELAPAALEANAAQSRPPWDVAELAAYGFGSDADDLPEGEQPWHPSPPACTAASASSAAANSASTLARPTTPPAATTAAAAARAPSPQPDAGPEDIAAAELAAYALEYAGVTGEPALHDPAWPPWVPWRLESDEVDERLVSA